jgi:16S rRNA (cytosine1402-N4)-methyltransferase
MAPGGSHRSVLLHEAVEQLNIRESGRYIDGTFGRGGHSQAILSALGPNGRLLAIDKDPEAIAYGRRHFAGESRLFLERASFAAMRSLAEALGWLGRVQGILLDLGVSSPQLDTAQRGFSFLSDGPLDMRMDPQSGPSAAQWLAEASERELETVLRELGEERFSRRIARALVKARAEAPITTTARLAQVVAAANPSWEKDKHPATRSFQAFRIHINRELEDLREGLFQSLELLAAGGRLVVISFHSLEDRIVKRFMRDQACSLRLPKGVPVTADQSRPRMRLIGKAVRPSEAEIGTNPRARSAVMRTAEVLP